MNKTSKKYLTEARIEAGKLADMKNLIGNTKVYKTIGLAIAFALISIAQTMLGEEKKDE